MTNNFIMIGSLLLLLFAVTTERWYSGGVRKAVGFLTVLIFIYMLYSIYMGVN